MKLHLPKLLRTVLMGLAAAVAPFALTVATASSVAVFAGVAQAEDVTVTLADGSNQTGKPTREDGSQLEAGDRLTIGVEESATVTWGAQVDVAVNSVVNVGTGATLNIGEAPSAQYGEFFRGGTGSQVVNLGANATMNTAGTLAGWSSSEGTSVINMEAGSQWNIRSGIGDACEYMTKTTINMNSAVIDIAAGKLLRVERHGNGDNHLNTLVGSEGMSRVTGAGSIKLQNWNLNLDIAHGIDGFAYSESNTADLRIEVAIIGGPGITKTGDGILELTHSGNTYSGGTTVNGGTLRLAGADAKAGTGTITVGTGATLELAHTGDCTTTNSITLNGNLLVSGVNETVTSQLTLASGQTMEIKEGSSLNLTAALTNNDTIVLDGTLSLGNVIANNGTITFGDRACFSVDLSNFDSSDSVTHGFAQSSFTLIEGGVIEGSATLTLDGQDYVINNGNRAITLSDASSKTVYYVSDGYADSLGGIQESSEGHLQTVHINGGTLNVDSALSDNQHVDVYGDSTLNITVESDMGTSKLNIYGGTVTKTGAATLTLGQAPAAGGLVVSEGSVLLSQTLDEEAGLGNIKVGGNGTLLVKLAGGAKGTKLILNAESSGTVEVQSGMLRVNGNEKSVVGAGKIVLNDGTGLAFANSGFNTVSNVSNDIEVNGTVTLRTWGNSTTTAKNTLSGKITGSGTLNKTDGGELAISGDMSKFTGAVSVVADNSNSNRLIINTNANLAGIDMGNNTILTVANKVTADASDTGDNADPAKSVVTVSTTSLDMGENSKITAEGSLSHDGVTYSGGAVIRNGCEKLALSVWQSRFSITGGAVAIEGSTDELMPGERVVNAVFKETAVTFNGTSLMTLNGTQDLTSLTTTKKTATLLIGGKATIGSLSGFDGVEVAGNSSLTLGAGTSELHGLTGSGNLTVNTGKELTVDGTIGSTTLGEGSSLKVTSDKTFTTENETISRLAAETNAVISGTGLVSVTTAGITYTNALIDVTATNSISTIAATLRNSEVRNNNSSAGVSVSADSLVDGTNDVTASGGDITISGVGDNGVTVKNLTVQGGNTISATTADADGTPGTIIVEKKGGSCRHRFRRREGAERRRRQQGNVHRQ